MNYCAIATHTHTPTRKVTPWTLFCPEQTVTLYVLYPLTTPWTLFCPEQTVTFYVLYPLTTPWTLFCPEQTVTFYVLYPLTTPWTLFCPEQTVTFYVLYPLTTPWTLFCPEQTVTFYVLSRADSDIICSVSPDYTLDLVLSRADSDILCSVSPDYTWTLFCPEQTVTFYVLYRADSDILSSVSPDNTLELSDHFCIVSQLNISRPTRPPVYNEARNIAAVDMIAFKDNLNASLLASPPMSAEHLHSLLSQLLDEHAPATHRKVSSLPLTLGFRLWHLNSWKARVNAAELRDTG
ncbi:hypothetical protein ACOMHN_012561 [Nucella lapillus]